MDTLAEQIKKELSRTGYSYTPSNQFSVEMTNMAVIVSQKIDLSLFTKQNDKLSLLFHLNRLSFKGPLRLTSLSASLTRNPDLKIGKGIDAPMLLMEKKYVDTIGPIPTKEELYKEVVQSLNNKDLTVEALLKDNTLQKLFEKELTQTATHKQIHRI